LIAARRLGQQPGELPGQGRTGRPVLVLEVDEGASGAEEVTDRPRPACEGLGRVLDGAEAKIAPVRGGYRRGGAVVMVDDAQRDVPPAQQPVDLLVEPARVAELEGSAQVGREQGEHAAEAFRVLLEVRRELEEEGTELPGEEAR